MYHDIRRRGEHLVAPAGHVHMGGQSIEDLSGLRQVGFERVDTGGGVGERHQVQVQHLVALREEVRDNMTASFSTAAGEHDALSALNHLEY